MSNASFGIWITASGSSNEDSIIGFCSENVRLSDSMFVAFEWSSWTLSTKELIYG